MSLDIMLDHLTQSEAISHIATLFNVMLHHSSLQRVVFESPYILKLSQRYQVYSVSASSADRIKPAGKFPKRLRFFVNGTSKFSGARQVVGETGKEVLLRRTSAYGTKYGIYVLGCFL